MAGRLDHEPPLLTSFTRITYCFEEQNFQFRVKYFSLRISPARTRVSASDVLESRWDT